MGEMHMILWTLIRWMADVVTTGDIENEWFVDMVNEFEYVVPFLIAVGKDIAGVFS